MFEILKRKSKKLFQRKTVEKEEPKAPEVVEPKEKVDFSNVCNSIKCPTCRQSMVGEFGKSHIVHIKNSTFSHSLYLLEDNSNIIPTPNENDSDYALLVYESIKEALGDGVDKCSNVASEIYLQPSMDLEITCPLCFDCNSVNAWITASKDTSTMEECVICGASTEMEVSSQNTTYVCSREETHKVSMAH